MDAHQGRVEHQVFVVAVLDQLGEHLLPHAGLGPAGEAGMDALPLAVAFGQMLPERAGTKNSQNAIYEQTVISAAAAGIADFSGQQRRYSSPLRLAQFIALHTHQSAPNQQIRDALIQSKPSKGILYVDWP